MKNILTNRGEKKKKFSDSLVCLLLISFLPLVIKIDYDYWNDLNLYSIYAWYFYLLTLFPFMGIPVFTCVYWLQKRKFITDEKDADRLNLILSLFIFLLLLTITAVISYYCGKVPDSALLTADDLFAEKTSLLPEPRESNAFLYTVFASPFLAAIALCVSAKLQPQLQIGHSLTFFTFLIWGLAGISGMYFVNALLHIANSSAYYSYKNMILRMPVLLVLSLLFSVIVLFCGKKLFVSDYFKHARRFFSVFSILYVLLFCLCNYAIPFSPSILAVGDNLFHANIIAYPVAQAVAGIYEVHQYGNYFRFVAGILRFWEPGYRAEAMFGIFGIIVAVQLLVLFRTVLGMYRNKTLAFLFVLSWGAIGSCDYYRVFPLNIFPGIYPQYTPIRTICAVLAISLVQCWLVAHGRKEKIILFMIGLLGGGAVFWNFDTGIIVWGAATVMVFAKYVKLRLPSKTQSWRLSIHYSGFLPWCSGILLSAVVLECWFSFQQHSFFNPFALDFQKIFYQSGFYMLPMEKPQMGIWWAVILLYAFGLLRGIRGYFSPHWTLHSKMSSFLSLMGIGLFSYYQGRSVFFNLISVSYPAVILLFLYSDDLIQLYRREPRCNLMYKVIVFVFSCAIFVYVTEGSLLIPVYALKSWEHVTALCGKMDAKERSLREKSKYILEKSQGRKSINIVGSMQGFFYLTTGTHCSIPRNNDIERILKRDAEKNFQAMKESSDPLFYTPCPRLPDLDRAMQDVLQYYTLIDCCGDLRYYEKKTNAFSCESK